VGPVEVFVDTSAIVASGDDFRLGSREFRLTLQPDLRLRQKRCGRDIDRDEAVV